MLTESEEKRIDEIYEEHAEFWSKLHSKLYYCTDEAIANGLTLVLIATGIVAIIVGIVIEAIVGIPEAIIGGFLTFLVGSVISLLCHFISMCIKCTMKMEKEFQEVGIPIESYKSLREYNDELEQPELFKMAANLTKLYLKYLPMKSKIDEKEFKQFLRHPPDLKQLCYFEIHLKENDKQELIEIFRDVRKRAEKMDISNECKVVGLTPLEFFIKYFYRWRIRVGDNVDNKSTIYVKAEKVYEKVFDIFQEFDNAPRISGSLVVELEDILEEDKDIIPVSKDKVMKLIEAWREYKTEIALA